MGMLLKKTWMVFSEEAYLQKDFALGGGT